MIIALIIILISWVVGWIGGVSCPRTGGGTKSRPRRDTKWADRWATGDLVVGYPETAYRLDGEWRSLHWGQRKLLLSEIDFLTGRDIRGAIVVYAGAADGQHIPFLADMFPDCQFDLYDPRPFHTTVAAHPRIRVNPHSADGFFTDAVAAKYKGQHTLLVSDIRTEPTEKEILLNQTMQQGWVRAMQPAATMLKFKMPYPAPGRDDAYTYLAGRIRLQCWAPVASAETRLIICDDEGDREWSIGRYERNMAWYNQCARLADLGAVPLTRLGCRTKGTADDFWSHFGVARDAPKGFDWIYEIQIFERYVEHHGGDVNDLVEKTNAVLLRQGEKFTSRLRGKGEHR